MSIFMIIEEINLLFFTKMTILRLLDKELPVLMLF